MMSKELDQNQFTLKINTPKKGTEKDRYCVDMLIENEGTAVHIDQIAELPVDEAREIWDVLIDWGFNPTQKTQKILDNLR